MSLGQWFPWVGLAEEGLFGSGSGHAQTLQAGFVAPEELVRSFAELWIDQLDGHYLSRDSKWGAIDCKSVSSQIHMLKP